MNREGFEKFIARLPKDKSSFLVGMESLRKTKTDKKDALTIAQFLMQEKETLSVKTPDDLVAELKDLARRREKLADHLTSLKGNMKRIPSVVFPELEYITGVFTKATLRLLMEYPSAHTIRKADSSAIADVFKSKCQGNRPRVTIKVLILLRQQKS
jgi:transposase